MSAMSLKQWRVPRTFSLLCSLTKLRTSSGERAEYNRSVPYARLPAQLVDFSDAQAKTGEKSGLAAAAEKSRMKVRLFKVPSPRSSLSRWLKSYDRWREIAIALKMPHVTPATNPRCQHTLRFLSRLMCRDSCYSL